MNNISGFSSAAEAEIGERHAAGGFPPLLIACVTVCLTSSSEIQNYAFSASLHLRHTYSCPFNTVTAVPVRNALSPSMRTFTIPPRGDA